MLILFQLLLLHRLFCLSIFCLLKALLEFDRVDFNRWEFTIPQFLLKFDQHFHNLLCHFDTHLIFILINSTMNCSNILFKRFLLKLDNKRRAAVTTFGLERVLHDYFFITDWYRLFDCLFFYEIVIFFLFDSDQWYFIGGSVVFGYGEVVVSFDFIFEAEEGEIVEFSLHGVMKPLGILPTSHLKLLPFQGKENLFGSISNIAPPSNLEGNNMSTSQNQIWCNEWADSEMLDFVLNCEGRFNCSNAIKRKKSVLSFIYLIFRN